MAQGYNDRFRPRDFAWLVTLSLLFFALVVLAFWREAKTDWAPIQKRFQQILEQHGQVEAAQRFQKGIRQLWIPQLGVVDSCVTCHLGYEWGAVLGQDLPQPFAPHPALPYLEKHPFEKFGCTICHGGQGWAVEIDAAHGGGEHWHQPLLSRELAKRYELPSPRVLIQMRCNACHRHDVSTPGMDEIDQAKVLLKERACIACHVIEGRGGLIAPELTYHGDKDPELFDFSHVDGPKSVFNWNVQHLLDPGKIFPGTTMPPFGFTPEEARALTLLLLSWSRQSFPPQYVPAPPEAGGAALQIVREISETPIVAGAEAGREVFRVRGCHKCHTVGGGKLLGPDLRGVGTRREDAWLRAWLADPAAMIRAYPELAQWPSYFEGILMPNQNLSSEEINALVAYLLRL